MTGSRDERVLDALAGRTVWSATPPPAMRGPAERLADRLRWASERGVAVTRLTVTDADALPVRRDDVVVMHDVTSVALTAPLRELGAHAVWNVSEGRALVVAGIDGYLVAWGRRVAAFIPACDRVADLDLDDAAWSGLLAAVVSDDRADRVGGTRRSRPVVAAH